MLSDTREEGVETVGKEDATGKEDSTSKESKEAN